MRYLTYLDIVTFRGVKDLKLEDLSKINIIVGDNNSGKTSLLEAIALLENPDSIRNMLINAAKRDSENISKFELFLEMFPKNQNESKSIHIKSIINKSTNELKIHGDLIDVMNLNEDNRSFDSKLFEGIVSLKKDGEELINKDICIQENNQLRFNGSYNIIKIVYVTPYDHFRESLLNSTVEIIKDGDKDKVVKLLQKFDENIIGFEVLPNNYMNTNSIYIQHKKYKLMPLSSFGDGVKKVITLASAIVSAKNGILLIDEIETAIYKDMISDVFSWFVKACMEYKVQLICTTHSLEAIDAMIEGIEHNLENLACYRIESFDEEVHTMRFSGNKLKDIRTILGQDVR
ncbi:AAA family ATPase [Paraclostridium bifermentans]|uniref:AAA family ATPase n=1 Tax=Paraclostridium bifermentans TaxID=1490 RepID=UPI00359C5391